ncbi:TusE/DsrC/DsvC family sulfur relay protein [Congregibacter variabilis]|uniref:Sulfurtransferase n=1 Tax=Congregibacter variabilis TaxID=3081200 RepID=A0ABZ0I7Y1_9GAMM|nr:TusE/DsrC/DsvC family sulfur relay protein [Congregibacter sp. IMCC43200]
MPNALLPKVNDEGFLVNYHDWNTTVATQIATQESIALSPAHWEIIELLREYYVTFDSSPAMRALVKFCKLRLGDEKGRSIYLLKLFPGSPAKIASKIAGLPKPANCL